jgi:hypothetical protein
MNDALTKSKKWFNEKLAQKVIESMGKNNISEFYVESEDEAREKLLSMIPEGSKLGYGGSVTLEQIGAIHAFRSGNYDFIDRHRPGISEKEQYKLRQESLLADVFVMSTNAITMDGKLVNIDGTGNRVAALIFGPSKVIVVAGVNKIVSDVNAAMDRIKNYVTPIHARRRDKHLPCAKTGYCIDCSAPERSCNAVVTIEHQRQKERITVIIVGKELGL